MKKTTYMIQWRKSTWPGDTWNYYGMTSLEMALTDVERLRKLHTDKLYRAVTVTTEEKVLNI